MITTYFNIKILGGEHIEEQDGVISQTIDPDQIRVVLTWGEQPTGFGFLYVLSIIK